jgi:hypothetical protein
MSRLTEATLSQATPISVTSRPTRINNRVGGSNLNDYYRFRFSSRANFNLALRGLAANADVALLNQAGQVIKRSVKPGGQSEVIRQTLDPGVYFIRVYAGDRQQNTPYQLSVRSTTPRTFNIKFDYRFDTNRWFTPGKRRVLEAAASLWENIIQDNFPTVPTGTRTPNVLNPQTGRNIREFVTNYPIDDLVVFVGARNLPFTTLAQARSSGWNRTERRYTGADFQPWIGSMTFDSEVNWFFDLTPTTERDIPSNRYDFISVAAHELGHILGFSNGAGGIDAFRNLTNESNFIGRNARARNGGRPIPLEFRGSSHIDEGYQFGGSGRTLMEARIIRGVRTRPTVLDAAILDDIGYQINYRATFRNSAPPRVARQRSSLDIVAGNSDSTYAYCGCSSCLVSSRTRWRRAGEQTNR